MKKLYDSLTGKEVVVGDVVKTFRGVECTVVGIYPSLDPGSKSTGRVEVSFANERHSALRCFRFYPSAIGCEIREE